MLDTHFRKRIIIVVREKAEKEDKMEETSSGWTGTVADLREWLNQFKETDTITFYGGEDSSGEFMSVLVNDSEVVCWG